MAEEKKADTKAEVKDKPVCGIVMPISAIDSYPATHWIDVREIFRETIEGAGFHPHLVSDAEDVGVIHKRIIQNLYDNPIVVCDISGKNPNVMFELGMRLAFDKPTIIVKDDKTTYSFDTGAIEHLEYPRDLRFNMIVDFKEKLAAKITATHTKATTDPSYTTFLKHFGEFTVAKLDKKEVSGQEFILEELKSISSQLTRMQANRKPALERGLGPGFGVLLEKISSEQVLELGSEIGSHPLVEGIQFKETAAGVVIFVTMRPGTDDSDQQEIMRVIDAIRNNGSDGVRPTIARMKRSQE